MKLKTAILFSIFSLIFASFYYIASTAIHQSFWKIESLNYQKDIINDNVEKISRCISVKDGKLILDMKKLKQIIGEKGWLQVLNEFGNETSSVNRPLHIPTMYRFMQSSEITNNILETSDEEYYFQSVHRVSIIGLVRDAACRVTVSSKLSDKYYLLVFTGIEPVWQKDIKIIMGVPDINKGINIGSLLAFISDLGLAEITILLLTLGLIFLLGYAFLHRIFPYKDITEGIEGLSKGSFEVYSEKGLFKKVFSAFNSLSSGLRNQKDIQMKKERQLAKTIHEVKGSLAVIKGYGEILSQTLNKPENREECKYINALLEKTDDIEILLRSANFGKDENS